MSSQKKKKDDRSSSQVQKKNKKSSLAHLKKDDDIAHLEKVLELMEQHQLAELEWERQGERLKLKSRFAPSDSNQGFSITHSPAPIPHFTSASSDSKKVNSSETSTSSINHRQKQITSPFVGTFYKAASPTSEPYVREGQVVKNGDTLCIIEAMKLMNEIEAEFSGKITHILVENGQPVEFGEPLFIIEP